MVGPPHCVSTYLTVLVYILLGMSLQLCVKKLIVGALLTQ